MQKREKTRNYLFLKISLVILNLLFSIYVAPLPVHVQADPLSPLHVDGQHIKDQKGNILNFVGATESQSAHKYDLHPYWNHGGDPIPMAKRMTELNVTWVRICVSYTYWSDPEIGLSYRDLIDRFVYEFTSRGIYCIVGNHGHEFKYDAPDNPTPWLNFLTELAERYKNNPGMCGIYMFNEPPSPWFNLDTWHEWAILGVEALHDVNPNLLKLIDADLSNRNGMDEYWLYNPIPLPNVVHVFHEYYWMEYYYNKRDYTLSYKAGDFDLAKQQMEESMYDRFFKYAVEHEMCIMLEEFGFNGGLNPAGKGYGNEPGWPQCQIDYMDLLKKYEIPWNQFDWWPKNDENYGLTKNDYYTLSKVGEIWQQYLEPFTSPPDELPPTEPIYTFDFETGDFPDNMNTQASAPNTIEISSAAPYSGSYSVNMVCPSGGRAVTIVKPGSLESVFVKAAFRLNQLPPKEVSAEFSDGNYVELFSIVSNPPYTKICSLRLRATANTLQLDLVQSYPVETVTSYEVSIVAKKYYLMTLGFVKASDGGYYVDLDGELLLEETGIDTSAYPSPNTVYSGVFWGTGDIVLHMDDLEIAKLKE